MPDCRGCSRGSPTGTWCSLDGLVASTAPEVLVPESARLRVVVLMHMPLGDGLPPNDEVTRGREKSVLSSVSAIVTTSGWTRDWLLDAYALAPDRVHVARPGVDPADLAAGTETGEELLCVAAFTFAKGYDVLLAALATVKDLPWRCVCVGTLQRDAGYVADLGEAAQAAGIGDRVRFTGPLTDDELDRAYAAADVLVLATRTETYGMVVTEALARGLPVIATAVGGLPEALGRVTDGSTPGLLVPADDMLRFAVALRSWLAEPDLRERLRTAARERRGSLTGWSDTATRIARVLVEVAR